MIKLLIATTNPGKLDEMKRFLRDAPIQLISLRDMGITAKPEETGETFDENAILKAKFYADLSGLAAIADDGGLEIDALHGEPGVKSHRWVHGDREDEDEELIEHALTKMKGLPLSKRGAQLRAVMALALPDGAIHTAEAKVRGVIPLEASKKRYPGFPYRSLLFIPKIKKYYAHDELTLEETETYNHRKKAIAKLKPYIEAYAGH